MKIGDCVFIEPLNVNGIVKCFIDDSGFELNIDSDNGDSNIILVSYIQDNQQKEMCFYSNDLEVIPSPQLSLYVFPEFMFTQCEYSELAFAIAESEERAKEIIAKKREQDVDDIYFGECDIHSLDKECCYLSL